MKNTEGIIQLGFVTIIVLVVAGAGMFGMSWMAEKFGDGAAMMFTVLVFVVIVIFVQQYLTGRQAQAVMTNIVNYAAADAKVDAYRQQTALEGARAMRATLTLEGKGVVDTQRLIEQKAGQLASMMTEAQVAKMRSQLFSQANAEMGENVTLD